jgi:hypothetical protein
MGRHCLIVLFVGIIIACVGKSCFLSVPLLYNSMGEIIRSVQSLRVSVCLCTWSRNNITVSLLFCRGSGLSLGHVALCKFENWLTGCQVKGIVLCDKGASVK